MTYDVVVVGGGPAGSTAATLLKKHAPDLKVLVLERERFPRDHVGESLLPMINSVLQEMGCWDLIEAADFPVKIGATYRWGTNPGLWDFEFLPAEVYEDAPRPAECVGQRSRTAFQVDRSVYDQILLEHAKAVGVEVKEGIRAIRVSHDAGRISHIELSDGSEVTARYYIDASGHSGFLRRSLGIEAIEPSALRNIAFWDYWQDADWAVSIGASGTRIQIRSLGWGWIWFIPISPTRTSIGLVTPADYYKQSGKSPSELYALALEEEPSIQSLICNATCENLFTTTKDWSFVAEKTVGENWFLIGEAAGFADPILSAGVSMAHVSGREAAYTIIALDKGVQDPAWLREEFDRRQRRRIGHHIRFADYWYTSNEQFSDLIEFTSEIAKDAGLSLDGPSAWRWLGTGGFVDEDMNTAGVGGYTFSAAKHFVNEFSIGEVEWKVTKNNRFDLNLSRAKKIDLSRYQDGNIYREAALDRDGKFLPGYGIFGYMVSVLRRSNRIDEIIKLIDAEWCVQKGEYGPAELFMYAIQALDAMCDDGWVTARYSPDLPLLDVKSMVDPGNIHANRDSVEK